MRIAWLGLLLVVGCEPAPSSGSLFEPVAATPPAVAEAPPAAPDGGFDFDADARPDDDGSAASDASTADLVAGLGLAGMPTPEPAPVAVPEPAPAAAPEPAVVLVGVAAPEPAAPLWPADSVVEGTWGVRLLATVTHANPPRAILGLPDGSEQVVQAGALLAEARVVVLAIGDNTVQIAEITPAGDHARVATQTMRALYPNAPRVDD